MLGLSIGLVGCVVSEQSDGDGSSGGGSGSSTDASSDGVGGDCEAFDGALAWSQQDDIPLAEDVVLDPLSSQGEFYVSYSGLTCLSRHGADGTEQWREDGAACEHMAIDDAGNVLLAGDANGRARIVKRGPDRSIVWTHERPMTDGGSEGLDVAIGRDGAVVVLGSGEGRGQWVLVLDADGNEQWTKSLPLELDLDGRDPQVGTDGDGNIIVAHTGRDGGDEVLLRVVSYTPDGDERWSVDQHGPMIGVEALGVRESGESLLGHYTFESDTTEAVRTLVMVDAAGAISWTKTSRDSAIELTNAIAFAPCDTIVLAGGGDPGPSTYGTERRLWVSKIDLAGTPLWSQLIDGPLEPDGEDILGGVAVDEDGAITAVGNVVVAVDEVPGEEFPNYDRDRWLGRFAP